MRRIYKGFSNEYVAREEITALLLEGEIADNEEREGEGGSYGGYDALIYTMRTGKFLCWIRTSCVQIMGEALAHGWTFDKLSLYKETHDDRYKLYPEPAEYSDPDAAAS